MCSHFRKMTDAEAAKYCTRLPERYHLIYLDYMDNFDGNIDKFTRFWSEKNSTIQHIVDTGRLIENGTYSKN